MVETFLIYLLCMQVHSEAYVNAKLIRACMCELSHTDSCTVWWLLILCNLYITFKSFEYTGVLSDRFVFKYSLYEYGNGIAHLVKWLNVDWDIGPIQVLIQCIPQARFCGLKPLVDEVDRSLSSSADISWSYCKSSCCSVIVKHRTSIWCEYFNAVLMRKILRQQSNTDIGYAGVLQQR
jgi:hypothetical protein